MFYSFHRPRLFHGHFRHLCRRLSRLPIVEEADRFATLLPLLKVSLTCVYPVKLLLLYQACLEQIWESTCVALFYSNYSFCISAVQYEIQATKLSSACNFFTRKFEKL